MSGLQARHPGSVVYQCGVRSWARLLCAAISGCGGYSVPFCPVFPRRPAVRPGGSVRYGPGRIRAARFVPPGL